MARKKNLPSNLGENLKRIRKVAGLTQEQVTKALNERGLNITRQSYNRYENNNAGPDYDTLIKLADIFSTDVNTLVGFTIKDSMVKPSSDKDKLQTTIFDMLVSDRIPRSFKVNLDSDLSKYTFSMPEREYISSDGRFMISPAGELELTEEQLLIIHKEARRIWDKAFLMYFLRVLRLVKDNQHLDEFLSKLQDHNGSTEFEKDATFIANNTSLQ